MKRTGKHGFTLLEVIIALGLLGLGLASILQAFPGAVRSSVRVQYNSRASLLAQQIIETLRADSKNLERSASNLLPIFHDFDQNE
ncbi:MAG TPA: prepilin-type N-terminal cleavage/methylation domain-containing protein, partial [bacterium]|nr:prepilin-type N-terminal cleavage/methylation domain-containing protein [bacterium]